MSKKKKQIKTVNKKFLNDLADKIYNPKTKEFLHLCNGTLQNGPDPTNPKRPMHCGLGELYFAMTGSQPNSDQVDEEDIIAMACVKSSFGKQFFENQKKTIEQVKKIDLGKYTKDEILDTISVNENDDHEILDTMIDRNQKAKSFYNILDNIPASNDNGNHEPISCEEDYINRARRVATQLRKAAKLLPE